MIPLYKPHMPKLPELDTILHSGQLASGMHTKEFERSLRAFFNGANIWVTNSFNMAIAVMISLLDIHPYDEVIASPMACLASTQPFAAHEINVKWADVDPKTGTLDPGSVEKRISTKTKVIFHNHFCGYPGHIDEINAIGKRYGIPVVDDGIEAFGSEYKGKKIGNCGTDITVFSFNAVRIPNTVDGGAIVVNDPGLCEKVELIRDCGINRKIFRDELGEINPECDITLRGHSATMSNVNAYIGIQQMKCMDKILKAQRERAAVWDQILKEYEEIETMKCNDSNPNYWVYGILVPDKREYIEKFREQGWYASGVHLNNNNYSIFGEQGFLPGVKEFYEHFVAIPCGWWINDKE